MYWQLYSSIQWQILSLKVFLNAVFDKYSFHVVGFINMSLLLIFFKCLHEKSILFSQILKTYSHIIL